VLYRLEHLARAGAARRWDRLGLPPGRHRTLRGERRPGKRDTYNLESDFGLILWLSPPSFPLP
jgi:hypothetical protein